MRLALYQPDIAQNTGTILRLAACLGLAVDIIEPAAAMILGEALRQTGSWSGAERAAEMAS